MDWGAVGAVIRLLSGKWDLVVVAQLEEGPRGYSDLLRSTGLDSKQLSRTLRHLEETGLVERQVQSKQPPVRVSYRLTPRARALAGPLDALARRWFRRRSHGEAGEGWAPVGIDVRTPNVARMYDYFLGGKDNFAVDREAADKVLAVLPEVAVGARANRAFLGRVVRFLAAEAGIRQFIDLGTGLPTQGSVPQIAGRASSEARVVCVDNDPVVVSHARALTFDSRVAILEADLRNPESILDHPQARTLIDFDLPVAVLMVSILHCIRDEEVPAAIIARFRDAISPGSYLVISHGSTDRSPQAGRRAAAVWQKASAPMVPRTRAEVEGFFEGFDLVAPGLVAGADFWRPEPATRPYRETALGYVGVGRKR